MMKKKLVTLLCALGLGAVLLSGCGKTAQEANTPSSSEVSKVEKENTETSVETQPEELDYVELDWYFYLWSGYNDIDMIEEKLNEYLLENLNCKVNIHMTDPSQYASQMSTKLLSGEPLDIVYMNGALHDSSLLSAGVYYPIDELWDKCPDLKTLVSDEIWKSLEYDGHNYYVPTVKDNCYIMGYAYNETLANEIGVDPENWNWKSFIDCEDDLINAKALRDAKHPEYAKYPLLASTDLMAAPATFFPYERFIASHPFAVCNVPGIECVEGYGVDEVFDFFETKEFREFCLMMQRLTESGVVQYGDVMWPDGLTPMNAPSTLVIATNGNAYMGEHFYSSDYVSKLVIFEDQVFSETASWKGASTAIGANCKDPERALMVIEKMNTDPYLATLLRVGIEGVHWVRQDDGSMTFDFEGGNNSDASNRGYCVWYGTQFGNLYITDAPEELMGPDGALLKNLKKYNDSAILAKHAGFTFDAVPVDNEMSACKNVAAEYTALWKGEYASAEEVNLAVDNFIEKLKANGVNKIVEEAQAQLDAWNASR